jgi:hypothetical protein
MHILMNQLGEDSPYSAYLKSLPKEDFSMSMYWPKKILTKVDSPTIIEEHSRMIRLYNSIHKEFDKYEHTK